MLLHSYTSKQPCDFAISVTADVDHYITMESFFLMTPKIVLEPLSSSKIALQVG